VSSLQAVLLFGFLTGYGAFRAFPVGKNCNRLWLAIGAASMIAFSLFLKASIVGEFGIFGL